MYVPTIKTTLQTVNNILFKYPLHHIAIPTFILKTRSIFLNHLREVFQTALFKLRHLGIDILVVAIIMRAQSLNTF